MATNTRVAEPALITIPGSDAAFRQHVNAMERTGTPADLEARLRRMFPRVVVRERSISGAPAWYVYRDGSWSSSLAGDWWDGAALPRVRVDRQGWITDADPTALGILGIGASDMGTSHITDFVVPGTLDDALGLFRIISEGHTLDATVVLRPTTGDVIAVDLHAHLEDDHVVGVIRLADDVDVEEPGTVVGQPAQVEFVPPTDVAFRGYVMRSMDRMPEVTPDGLVLRLRRLYPHATLEIDDHRWVARRDRGTYDQQSKWWEESDVPLVRYDAQALILEANDAAEAFFGRSMVGHYWQEFVTPGSTDQVSVMLDILTEVGAAKSRFRMPRGDGTLVEFNSYTEVRGEEFVTMFRRASDA